jgi:N-acetylglucosamine-6-phosphate deacetylase
VLRAIRAIVNGRLLTPAGVIENGLIEVENGLIKVVRPGSSGRMSADTIDARGRWVLPGFIDLHCHGGLGWDVMDASAEGLASIARHHAGGGATAFLPTTASTSLDDLLASLELVRQVRRSQAGNGFSGARLLGAHIEGPYFAQAKRGCHLARFVRDPEPAEYAKILAYRDDIASMTLAPELPGAERLVRSLAECGILACLSHTEATYDQVSAAVGWGARHVTHLYCAMSTITRRGPYRSGGLVEAALVNDELSVELIADGKHLPAELIRLALKAKGPGQVCAVTDAMRGTGMPDGRYAFGPRNGQQAVVSGGAAVMPDNSGFASGVARMNELVRVLRDQVGLPLAEAVNMVSLNPARVLGLDARMGSLQAGKQADLVIADDDLEVQASLVQGQLVYERPA